MPVSAGQATPRRGRLAFVAVALASPRRHPRPRPTSHTADRIVLGVIVLPLTGIAIPGSSAPLRAHARPRPASPTRPPTTPDRPSEPPCRRGEHVGRPAPAPTRNGARRLAVPRRRPLQARERHGRPLDRRRAAHRGRQAPAGDRAPSRPGGEDRRRRIRDRARRRGRRRSGHRVDGAHPPLLRDAVHGSRRGDLLVGQPGRRLRRRQRPGRRLRDDDPRRRHRDVPGEGRRT